MARRVRPAAERFVEKIDRSGGPEACHPFTAHCDPHGYGQFGRGRRGEGLIGAHVFAFEQEHGPVPPGLFVLHACDNPPCCNVRHLFSGTARDNSRDMAAKGRTVTRRGLAHPRGRLSDDDVRAIRRRSATESASMLARQYGVSSQHVGDICRHKRRQSVLLEGSTV